MENEMNKLERDTEPNNGWTMQPRASRDPCSCSALTKACERMIKYLREIGESTRGESTIPSAEYADAMADDLEHVLNGSLPPNKEVKRER